MFCLWVNAPGTAQYSFTSILRAYWSCFDRDNVSHKLTTTRYKPLNKYKQLVPVHATNKQPPTAKPPHKETFCQKKEETERNKPKSINPTHVEHEHRTYRILLARYFILANHDNHLCVVVKVTEDKTIQFKWKICQTLGLMGNTAATQQIATTSNCGSSCIFSKIVQ